MKNIITHILQCIFLITLCSAKTTNAQLVNHRGFNKIGIEQGLSNSVVYEILQDNDGFLWFTSKDGLNKFDGINITKYSPSERAYQNAKDNIVFTIEHGPASTLYCATASGRIYKFNKNADKFEKVNISGSNPLISPIWDLYFKDDENLMICSASGFFNLNINTSKIQYINNISIITRTIFKDDSGNYWVGTDNGLYSGDISTDSTLVKSNLEFIDALGENVIYSINQDLKNRIWIGTRDIGLFVYDQHNDTFQSLNRILLNQYGHIVPVQDITVLPDRVIIALDGKGICVFDYGLNIIQTYKHIDDVTASLSNNGVYDVFFDKDNTMWIATYGGGVNFLHQNHDDFIEISHEPYNKNSLKNNTARSFLEANDGKLWFGTKKGLSILDVNTGEWNHLGLNENGEEEAIALSLCQSSDHQIWIGTYNNGLIKVNPTNYYYKHIKRVNIDGEKVGSDFLYSVIEDSKGRIWSGGIHGNLTVYNSQTKITKEISIDNVKTIFESPWGTIYVGTTHGLYVVDVNTFAIERPKPSNVLLNQNRIYCIYGDSDSNKKQLWLGTEGGGLILWDMPEQRIKVYSITDGLPSNFIYGIQKDNNGALWLSTTYGLSKLNPNTLEIINYDHSDGLSDQEFNFGAHGKTRSGKLIFGGQHGFTYIDPDKIETDSTIPHIVFNSFKLFGKEQVIGEENSVLSRHINTTKQINLKHNQNSLSFQFSAINFTNPNKIQYSWMLEGFDDNWNEPTYSREAIYTNLKPGDYIFKVKASNQSWLWGNDLRKIIITITPPFSKSIWAYMIYYLIIIGLILLTIHYYRIRTKEKNAIEKTRFFINIAHDLRTPLTLVKAPLEQLSNSGKIEGDEKGSLILARKNVDRLNRLVTQLMDFQKADLNKLQFYPAPYNFIAFFKETAHSFQPLFEKKNLQLSFNIPEQDFELWFDKNKMEKVIFNLISNAIKYTENEGTITLSILNNSDYCSIQIDDNGLGIPKEQQKMIFTRYFRAKNSINSQETGSGVGLMLVKKLVELHQGSIKFKSVEGKGTTFIVKIPHKQYESKTLASEQESEVKQVEVYQKSQDDIVAKIDPNRSTYKVLLVEDNLELLNYVAGILSKYFEVLTAGNGEIGLEIAKGKHVDLIISDIMMPLMDGNQMCHLLKSSINTCHIPVILLTALNTIDYKIEGLKVGADAYIEKPFDMSYLVAQVNNLLTSRQQLKEKFALQVQNDETPSFYNSIDTELINKAKIFIHENIMNNDLSVEMLAKELCMSRPVLYRKIKALTDQSPQDFIRLIKLVEAKKLLMDQSKSISDVAYETGFSDPKYFSTSFKKQFGCTPSQYTKGKGV